MVASSPRSVKLDAEAVEAGTQAVEARGVVIAAPFESVEASYELV